MDCLIGVASTSQLGGPHIVKDEMQVEDQLSKVLSSEVWQCHIPRATYKTYRSRNL